MNKLGINAHFLDGAYFLASTLLVQGQPYVLHLGQFPRGL